MPKSIDLSGKTFGHWFVIEKSVIKNGRWHWKCQCDCGKIKNVEGGSLRKRTSVSCGCDRDKKTGDRSRKHGGRGTRLYSIWKGIRKRCFNKKDLSYKNYGERGINICDDWSDFSSFRKWSLENGYAENLSIDRINNDGNYEPSNCRWATFKIQANNTRKNHWVEINGEKKTITECAKIAGITPSNILERLKAGYSGEELLKPSLSRNPKIFIKYKDNKYSVNELSKLLKIDALTIYKRLQYGFVGEKLFKKPQKKIKIKLSDGKKYTTRELATMSGLKIGTIHTRINHYGFKGDEIINSKKWEKRKK